MKYIVLGLVLFLTSCASVIPLSLTDYPYKVNHQSYTVYLSADYSVENGMICTQNYYVDEGKGLYKGTGKYCYTPPPPGAEFRVISSR